jgi:hypothetical protein
MKIFYKLLIDETNTVIGLSSDNVPFKTPGDVVIDKSEIENAIKEKFNLEKINYYVVDENGNSPIYEEIIND